MSTKHTQICKEVSALQFCKTNDLITQHRTRRSGRPSEPGTYTGVLDPRNDGIRAVGIIPPEHLRRSIVDLFDIVRVFDPDAGLSETTGPGTARNNDLLASGNTGYGFGVLGTPGAVGFGLSDSRLAEIRA